MVPATDSPDPEQQVARDQARGGSGDARPGIMKMEQLLCLGLADAYVSLISLFLCSSLVL